MDLAVLVPPADFYTAFTPWEDPVIRGKTIDPEERENFQFEAPGFVNPLEAGGCLFFIEFGVWMFSFSM